MIIVFYTELNSNMEQFTSFGIFSSLENLKTELKTKNSILLNYQIIFTSHLLKSPKRIKDQEIILFFQELSILLKSGLSLTNSLVLLLNNLKKSPLKPLVLTLYNDIKSGKSLRISINPFKKTLSPFYITLIIIGEESGTLPETLEVISQNIKKNNSMKKKVRSLLIYPVFIFFITLILSIILINFVLPEFIKIFNDSNIKLPFLTSILLKFYNILSNFFYPVIVVTLSLPPIFCYLSNKKTVKNLLYRTLTIFFPIYRVYVSFFLLKNLSILLNAGISLFSSLKILHLMEENPILKGELTTIIENLKKGDTLYNSISDSYFFSQTVLSMISVGENSGTLPFMLSSASELTYHRFNNLLENSITLIEPLTLIILGGIIGTIILALYLPMFDALILIK